MRKATNHKITRAPKPAITPTGTTPVTTTTHPASKPLRLSRPRSKATPKPIPTPLVGPPVIVPVPVAEIPPQEQMPPTAPPVKAPVEATTTAPPVNVTPAPPLINAAQMPTPDTGFSVSEWAIDGKKPPESPVLPLVEVGLTAPPTLTAPPAAEAPAIVEWALNGTPTTTELGNTPAPVPENVEPVPVFSLPPTHTVEDVSSIQIGDVLIVAIKVMPNPLPIPPPTEATP